MAQAKGRRDGISSNEKARTTAAREGVAWQGPRTLVLRKNSQGFGFTLRHFIVYPPESSLHTNLQDEENGNGKGLHQSRLEPMDTIFVKSVRERGPAHQAGLCTGDRLVKVNGESVLGKTYSQVIALIQNSESLLELSIMPKDEDVLQLVSAYSQDAYLRGNDPYSGGARDLPDPPPLCYPSSTPQPPPGPAGPPMGQNQLDNWSRWPGSEHPSPLDNRPSSARDPGGAGRATPTHRTEEIQYGMTGKQQATGQTRGRTANTSPHHYPNQNAGHGHGPAPQPRLSRGDRCQQALTNWYYSQAPPDRSGHGHAHGRAPPPRHRSYSQDRLSEGRGRLSVGWPHSSSQDTLLLAPPLGHAPAAPGWAGLRSSRARSENQLAAAKHDRSRAVGRSLEMLDHPERGGWRQQQAPPQRAGSYYSVAPPPSGRQARPQQPPRRPPPQPAEEPLIGYRSYSPSFYRKAGRFLQAQSFRDPSPSGPPLSWTPSPRSSPPDPAPALGPASSASSLLSAVLTNHERLGPGPEVVLRQKPPTGRRSGQPLRPGLPPDAAEPPDAAASPPRDPAPRRTNGGLPHPPLEDDSLATIPFIDEPTSPTIDLRARHVPASSVVSSAMSSAHAGFSPALPPFSFPPSKLFSQDCSNIKSGRRSSYLEAITTERSKSCDEGLNTFRDEGRVFSRLPKRVKSYFGEGSLDSLATGEESLSKRHSTSELGNLTFSDVRKEGWLQYKQIVTEKGKKVGSAMRPWKRAFSVLRSHSLFLYKDKREAVLHGAAVLGLGGAEDEQPISIRGCLVDIAYSETKRKHALRLTTQDFCEYLLQAEDQADMLGWIEVIRENSKNDSEELGISGQALINKKLNDYRKQSPTGSKPDSSPKVHRMMASFHLAKPENAGGVPRSPKADRKDEGGPAKAPWGINIMKKSKKAGPKAFGVRLEDCQPAVNNRFIPLIVEICCGLVEEMGLEYTGIYRVPGNNAMVSSLQEQLNKGVDINPAEEKWQDLNVVSSLLKSFFRKLPEPVFTDDKYNDFIDANRMENTEDRLKTMNKLIHDLPDCYYHTLKFLVGHLKTVADHADKNKMEPRNLALVFGPTLVRTSEDNMTDMVTHMPDRYKIVETLIQHYDWFFSEDLDKDEKTPVDTADLQPVPNIDHLLSNIGRTGVLGEASDSTNSDSAKSKGSWGSKRDLSAKDFLSIMSAVTRKRKKRPDHRVLGSSTDEDSEQEPNRAAQQEEGEEGAGGGAGAPRAEGEEAEEEDEEDEEEEEAERTVEEVILPRRQREEEEEEEGEPGRDEVFLLPEEVEEAGARAGDWRGTEDERSVVSGYSTLSTLGRSRGDEADDECSELVSETDNESGFASRSLTQERPEKPPPVPEKPALPPRSFLYGHCKPPGQSLAPPGAAPATAPEPDPEDRGEEEARSTTPSSSSFSSSSSVRPYLRPSFCSRRLIQGDTLARKKVKGDKAKVRSLDLDLELGITGGDDGVEGPPASGPQDQPEGPRRRAPSPGPAPSPEAASFSPGGRVPGAAWGSLADQVRARLMGSADDLRGVGLRPAVSPETRRKRRAWRRHTVVVDMSGQGGQVPSADKPPAPVSSKPAVPPRPPRIPGQSGQPEHTALSVRPTPPSRFHEYL
ncbi:rho GTPase-activating protein 23-like [Conger conger]|uniref:rho GTPase-activating protein 23-like n=1 Tax=Conger conger TaxID=82655 RepID=UPI002A59EB34|nr:rho GTPase-activating protein 23-like [Conger conger]